MSYSLMCLSVEAAALAELVLRTESLRPALCLSHAVCALLSETGLIETELGIECLEQLESAADSAGERELADRVSSWLEELHRTEPVSKSLLPATNPALAA